MDRRRFVAGGLGGLGGLATGLVRLPSALAAPAPAWPGASWTGLAPAAAGFDPAKLTSAVNHAKSKGGSGFVSRYGYQVAAWGGATQRYNVKSSTKSMGSLLTALALEQGLVGLQDAALSRLDPEFGVPPDANATAGPGWRGRITLQHLLDHTAGFAKRGGFEPLLFAPGSYYLYSDGGTNWLADIVTVRFGADLQQVFRRRIARPVGIPDAELGWRTHAYRPATLRGLPRREFGSGLSATARAFARVGLLLLRGGQWRGTRLVPAGYLDRARHARPELAGLRNFETGGPSALTHYNLYFWNNEDGIAPNLPGDVFFTWGLHNNHAFVVPGLELVVVRLGTTGLGDDWGSVNRLLGNFVAAVAPSTSAQATLVARAGTPEERLTPAQRRRLRERPITTDE